jgi:hypothetical protein
LPKTFPFSKSDKLTETLSELFAATVLSQSKRDIRSQQVPNIHFIFFPVYPEAGKERFCFLDAEVGGFAERITTVTGVIKSQRAQNVGSSLRNPFGHCGTNTVFGTWSLRTAALKREKARVFQRKQKYIILP